MARSLHIEVDLINSIAIVDFLEELRFDNEKGLEFAEQVGSEMIFRTEQRFVDEVDPWGIPWPKSLRAIEENGRTLFDRGVLFQSLTFIPSPTSVEWGTNKEYAPILQTGGTIRPVNGEFLKFKIGMNWITTRQSVIPPREFLGVNPADEIEISEILKDVLGNE